MPIRNSTPSKPVTYTDKGGGGPLPPHGEDFFDRIVNVHWRKPGVAGIPIFANGGQSDFQHIIKLRGEQIQFSSGPNPVFSGGGGINASSSHTVGPDINGKYVSVMLVGGATGGDNFTDGTIAASVDGSSWSKAANFHDSSSVFGSNFNDNTVLGLVYDGLDKNFYACVRNVKFRRGVGVNMEAGYYEVLYMSSRGVSGWSEVGRRKFFDSEGNPGLPSNPILPDLFLAHCNNVPHLQDGVFGRYELIGPTNGEVIESVSAVPISTPIIDLRNVFPLCTPNSGINVTSYQRGHSPINRSVSAPFPVNAAAYAGGVLVVTGGTDEGTQGRTAVSLDLGATWMASYGPEFYAFWTICGGFTKASP